MARVKKSKATLNKETYERYRLALSFYGINLKPLKQPTAKSVTTAKSIWTKNNRNLKAVGYTDLPTPSQAAQYMRDSMSKPQIQNDDWFEKAAKREYERTKEAEANQTANVDDTLASFEIREMFNELFRTHNDFEAQKHQPSHNEWMKHKKAQEKLMEKVEWGIQKLGDYEFAQALKQSDYMGRVEALIYSTHYLYQETEIFEEDAPAMLEALINETLDNL